MATMHHDESADLKVVGNKLKDILEVLALPLYQYLPRKRMPFDVVWLLFLLQKFAQYHFFGHIALEQIEIVLIRTNGDKSNLNFRSQGSGNQIVDFYSLAAISFTVSI